MTNHPDTFVASTVRKAVLDCIASKSPSAVAGDTPAALFAAPVAEAIKAEILLAGKKLWHREYVDGNGGNISARISDDYVICTPTLCSKGDMLAHRSLAGGLEQLPDLRGSGAKPARFCCTSKSIRL